MSEPVVKQRPTMDLDDFERRLRHASSQGRQDASQARHDASQARHDASQARHDSTQGRHDSTQGRHDDPLAELARLVGEPYDPFGEVFAQEAMSTQPGHGGRDQHESYAPQDRREPGFAADTAAPRLFGDFAAIEAGLRGRLPHADPAGFQHPASYDQGLNPQYEEQPDVYGHSGFEPDWAEQRVQPPASRMRRPIYVMAATIAVGVIGIGAAFALKGRVATSPSEVKTIMADAGPTKIQPPPDAAADAGAADANAFGKGNQTAPTRLVSREEQPVDIGQTVQDNAARAAQLMPGMSSGAVTDASSVPVPPSPGQMKTAMADPQAGSGARQDAIGDQVQSFGLSDMPAPKRVRVVSVKPDGTILPNDQPPAAAMPARARQSR